MTSCKDPETRHELSIGLGLFVISVAILTLEVLQIRILSVQMWYHHAYMVVSMTLLGFAAAGTVVTVWPGLAGGDVRFKLAGVSSLFAVAIIAAYFLLSITTDQLKPLSAEGNFGSLSIFYSLMVLPYFFGGLVVTIALSSTQKVHKRYFVNLVGSALGAWVFILAITPLGGERLLVLCAILGPVAALCFLGRPRIGKTFSGALIILIGCVVLFSHADQWLKVKIGKGKLRADYGKPLERRWTPLSCVDLIANKEENPSKIHILQDGGAGTFMYRKEAGEGMNIPKHDPYACAYVPHLRRMKEGGPPPKVIAIGIGGGTDLHVAVENGAKSVLGVEINGEVVRILREDYADFNGGICHRPGVKVIAGEGRSVLRRIEDTFDIIQISGVDTYTAANSGSFVLSESYLYTLEAIRDYFDHLSEGGTLGITRFADEPPWEMLRLFAMGLTELKERGIERPSQHAVLIRRNYTGGAVFSLVPFHPRDIEFYLHPTDPKRHNVLYVPGMEGGKTNDFIRLAEAFDAGTEEAFYKEYPVDIRPVSDDSPFFYNFHHVGGSWKDEVTSFEHEFDYHFPMAPKILSMLLGQVSILVLVLVLLPLLILKRSGLQARSAGRHLVYFLGLGVAFMFLEISTIQRLALFLGHPTYSITVALFAFLFFAGLGSLWSGRLGENFTRGMRWSVALLALVILAFTAFLNPVLNLALPLPLAWRVVIAIGLLAPMNFLMGMPFPLGLRRLKRLQPQLVPWALGANGGASVIGSILCVMIAMESGFTAVSLISAAVYVIAMLAATTGPLSAGKVDGKG